MTAAPMKSQKSQLIDQLMQKDFSQSLHASIIVLNGETAKMMKRVSTRMLLLSLALGVAGWVSSVQAGAVVTDTQAIAGACVISKQKAEQTAKAAVGGGTVILARCEKGAYWHWSIDIRSKTHKYGVWVSTANKVVKADLFPFRPAS